MALRHALLDLPHLHHAVVAVAIGGGPRWEGPRQGGLTHFLEHVLFRGAGELSGDALLAAFEEVGGEPEAYTSEDMLMILCELDPAQLERGVGLLHSILSAPNLTELEAERALILEERLEGVDGRGQANDLEDLAAQLAFQGHPLARSILGRKRDILRVQEEDLRAWWGRIVGQANLGVAVAGPLGEAAANLLRPLEGLPLGAPLVGPPLPEPRGPRLACHSFEGSQIELRLSFFAPGQLDPAFPALQLLVDLLDGGPTARLPRLVDTGLAYQARVDLLPLAELSLLEVELAIAAGRGVDALEAVLHMITELGEGMQAAELARAATRRRHLVQRLRDDPRQQSERAARQLLLGLPADPFAPFVAAEGVAEDALLALSHRVFQPSQLSAVAVGELRPRVTKRLRTALEAWPGVGS